MPATEEVNLSKQQHSGIIQATDAARLTALNSAAGWSHLLDKTGNGESSVLCHLTNLQSGKIWVTGQGMDRPQALEDALTKAEEMPAEKRPLGTAKAVIDENERLKAENESMAEEIKKLRKGKGIRGGAAPGPVGTGGRDEPVIPDADPKPATLPKNKA